MSASFSSPVSPGTSVSVDLASWDEAFLRVESYLRAHHIDGRVHLNELATQIIREARELGRQSPDEDPVVLAMRVTQARIGAWFARAGSDGDWSNERVRARGRLALLIANLPGRWPNSFLNEAPVPVELSAAMTSGQLRSGPELRLSNMPPAPLEFGFDDPTGGNSQMRGGLFVVRAAGWWLSIVGLFGVAWAASH